MPEPVLIIFSHFRLTLPHCNQRCRSEITRRGKIAYIKDEMVERKARWRFLSGKQFGYWPLSASEFPFANFNCTSQDEASKTSSAANELGLANVGGVFVVLMGGMGVACVIAVCEFVWKSRKVAVEERVS